MRAKVRYWAEAAPLVGRHVVGRVIEVAQGPLWYALRGLSVRRRRELARRQRVRPHQGARWLTSTESALLGAVAALIVPSDEHGPGAKEADVVGTLDRLVAGSPWRQSLYGPGLLGFDEWAVREHGQVFTELPAEQQRALLAWAEQMCSWGRQRTSLPAKVARKVVFMYQTWRCPVLELFPELVKDVVGAFYISPVAWQWLGYDGPPLPLGYPDLLDRAALRDAQR